MLIHTRTRFPKAWEKFLWTSELLDTWAKAPSHEGATVPRENDCSVGELLEHSLHPAWVSMPETEFFAR